MLTIFGTYSVISHDKRLAEFIIYLLIYHYFCYLSLSYRIFKISYQVPAMYVGYIMLRLSCSYSV